jgi:hypothetical protein
MALPTLRQGTTGKAVEYLQERLDAHGFHLKVDGDFGAKTDAAVDQFQASRGLTVDGIVGSRTWDALLVESSVTPPSDLVLDEKDRLKSLIPTDTPAQVRTAIECGINDLGLKEIPNGSNEGPEIKHLVMHYNQYWWVLKDGADTAAVKARGYPLESECIGAMAWCGMAVSNWIREGLGLPYWDYKSGYGTKLAGHPFEQFFGGPVPVEKWAQSRGTWVSDTSEPCPAGACFTISRSTSGSDPSSDPKAGHIGMVICDHGDGTIETIEGNVSNKVDSYTRKKKDLRGWTSWW